MHQRNIQQIVDEIGPLLVGRYLGKVFQLEVDSLAIDFGLKDGRHLFLSFAPAAPRIFLIKRRSRDLEKQSSPRSSFAQFLWSSLSGARVIKLEKDPSDRIVRMTLDPRVESGDRGHLVLVAQLTGRSANLFILDAEGRILSVAKPTKSPGQSTGDVYQLPSKKIERSDEEEVLDKGSADSFSAAFEAYFLAREEEQAFQVLAKNLRSGLKKEIQQRTKLLANLQKDLADHGDPDEHKKLGDLLLANVSTAKRKGDKVLIRDLYEAGEPEIELEIDKDATLTDEAARYFSRYTKAKRAREEISSRLAKLALELDEQYRKQAQVEQLIESGDRQALAEFSSPAARIGKPSNKQRKAKIPGVRIYRSSDGYEILVGRGARDNDNLTFKVARPNDLWLHSADYPGSHVVVRREGRKDLPQRTIIEAAELAAHFSQAGKDSKVIVHYTPRKFLSKPKGSAPGLVRMSSFKTILVQPKEALPRE